MGVSKHDAFLDDLIYNFKDIDEDPKKVNWVMKDGIWLRDFGTSRFKMPDIIAGYSDGKGYLVAELKGSKKKRDKARVQIESGIEMLMTQHPFCCTAKPYFVKKFVTYSRKGYNYEVLE